MSDTVVHLLRHGKVHNPREILYGRLPGFPLAASGRAMAQGVADHLTDTDITVLVASPLLRAQQTAEPLAERLGLPVATDDRLIEAGNAFEGRRVDLRGGTALADPRTWARLRNPLLPSWGEPYLEIAHRMLGVIYEAVLRADGHQAVLVTHQLPIVTVRRYLQGQRLWHDPRRRQCSVASLTSFHFTMGVFTQVRYSEPVAHIPGVNDPGMDVGGATPITPAVPGMPTGADEVPGPAGQVAPIGAPAGPRPEPA